MKKKNKFFIVSNAHLDTQWNWTIQDTIRDCVKNTLQDNFTLLEKYPHYVMNFEGAFRYKLAKEYYPHLYEKLKKYVADGRWNVAGSQWDASDANVPSSEGFMRQILYGNGFFESEFGKKSTDIFLTDCFGFRYSLPSIAAHMGLNGFSTQKLVWGVGSPIYNKDGTVSRPMPDKDAVRMDLGKWIGPDGNFVIGSFLCGDYTRRLERGDDRPLHERKEYLEAIKHNEKYAGVPSRMMYYGTGDYGGAPSDGSARLVNEAVEQNGDDKDFEVIAASSDAIYNSLTKKQIEKMPAYRGNLLIPHGYGAATSHTINKRWNRKCELLADAAERAASTAKWLGRAEYPKERIDFAWKLFLWHQFHDDLPGTSILDAYRFSYNDYVIAQNILAEELTASSGAVISALDTRVDGEPVVVYNPTSFKRTDVAAAELPEGAKYVKVFGPDGKEVPSQISKADGRRIVKFTATVAPVSYTVFSVVPSDEPCDMDTGVSASLSGLENGRYKVTLNGDGYISSVYDKKNGRELLSAPSSLGIREDNNTNWPSWEIKYEDTKLPFRDVGGVCSVTVAEAGPALAALRIVRREGASEYIQTVSLCAGGQRVEVDNNVNWGQRRSLLSAAFPLAVSAPEAEFDLGLGAEKGGNTDSFPYFQRLVHQWADLTDKDGSFGVAVLNDCKYAMEKPDDGTLRLTLIHTPLGNFRYTSAQDWQDQGKNIFKYGLTSHKGSRAGVAAEAACLNSPLICFSADKHAGRSASVSFVSVSTDDAVIRCLKREEKGDRLIVRVQETSGHDLKNVRLRFAGGILDCRETNGYEEGDGETAFKGRTLTFDMTPFSVRTFAVRLKERKAVRAYCAQLPLEYDARITTPQSDTGAGRIGSGISVPEEIYERNINAGGVGFTLGRPGENNAVICRGQKIRLPAGAAKAVILAASAAGDKKAEFRAGKRKVVFTVPDFSANVGCWDQIGAGDHAYIKRAPVAVSYSHSHDENGDRLYKFVNIFKFEADTLGARTLTLPSDPDIIVTAVSVVGRGALEAKPVLPLYDTVKEDESPVYLLKTHGMTGEGGYREGELVRVCAPRCNESGQFKRFEGDADVVLIDGVQALVRMGGRNAEIRPVYENNGKNAALGRPYRESSHRNDNEKGGNALNGTSADRWCAEDKGEPNWLEVDLGKSVKIGKWLVEHCSEHDDKPDNTCDFRLEYRTSEKDGWKTADSVEGNTADFTVRDFKPVKARYVRLFITKGAIYGGTTARIYQFHVYECE